MSGTRAPEGPRAPDIGRRTLSTFGYAVTIAVPILIAVVGIMLVRANYDPEDVVTGTRVPLLTSDWRPGAGGDDGLIQGVLAQAGNGCIVLRTAEQGDLTVVWPFDFEATVDNKVLKLYDTDRTIAARGGDTVSMGGGYGDVGTYAGQPCAPPAGTEVAFVQSEVTVTARG